MITHSSAEPTTLNRPACSLGSAPPPATAKLVMVRYPARPTTARERQTFLRTSADTPLHQLADNLVAGLTEQSNNALQPLGVDALRQGEAIVDASLHGLKPS